ncbi:MAG: hypothetical protein ABIT76_11990 [Chthoniobacterales bacterium]
MHNEHTWKERTADGDKREVRAVKFGGNWRIQAKLRNDPQWTYFDTPLMDDLLELREVLFRKYQRRRAAVEDVLLINSLIVKRGGESKYADSE